MDLGRDLSPDNHTLHLHSRFTLRIEESRVYTGEEDNKVNLGFITIIVLIITIVIMMTL